MPKTAIISGITGQIGSYLAEHLLKDNYRVYGIVRKSSHFNTQRIDHLYENKNLTLVYGDLLDQSSISSVVGDVKPDLFFHLAALSHVRVSFDLPVHTADVTGVGVVRCLEAIRKFSPKTRFYNAATSELFGTTPPPQSETTPFHPASPYAAAKLYGYWITRHYREAYNMFCSNGIVFNSESERRGETFVTRKISRAVGRIAYDLQSELELGNLEARRDWGHAKDSARAMQLILEHRRPDDFCIATGQSHSIKEFLQEAFGLCDLDYKQYVKFNPRFIRAVEVDHLCGDFSKARRELGWKPTYTFKEIVKEMVDHDLKLAKQEYILKIDES